ncbi:hypothetical protein DFP93_103239 [Aneurinibacillus soli]|uniref:Uncharacterized protein n=1 Tax=Aneurinibacillus soli TaxID=1500254 RepID=A0A0U5B2T3_9BACL|nr:hypothetical protein [Aneurinibacillus soli]PYE63027.1 hypothetical protein DFP93_103239 [Aneurinibacillus soli]BAU28914.1 hypothetical protein CB4_03091 [Aneurinibacillus soli]
MNAGYFSFCCLLLIWIVGWMGMLDGLSWRIGIRPRFFLFLLLAVLLTGNIEVQAYGIGLYIGSFLLPLGLFAYVWAREEKDARRYVLTAALLAGVTLFLLRYMLRLDPVLQIVEENYLLASVALLLTLMMSRDAAHGLVIVGLAFCIADILFAGYTYQLNGQSIIGSLSFRDGLVLALIVSLSGQRMIAICIDIGTGMARRLFGLRKGREQ